jgi:hypothetical protein
MKAQKIFAMCVLSLGLWGCAQPGPAERLGKRVDTVTGSQERDAQRAGRNVDDAADDVRRARKDLEK